MFIEMVLLLISGLFLSMFADQLSDASRPVAVERRRHSAQPKR